MRFGKSAKVNLIFAVAIGGLESLAGPLDPWQRRDQSPPANWLYDVAYGNGMYAAVGDDVAQRGTLMTSVDGDTWSYRALNVAGWPTNCPLYSVVFGNGAWIIGGKYGVFLVTSTNAETWSAQYLDFGATVRVAYCGDKFFSLANGWLMRTSTNGAVWSLAVSVPTSSSICFGNGTYVAVGSGVITSTNAEDWTVQSSGTTNSLSDVIFSQNMFVAVGKNGTILTSPDAINWTSQFSGTTQDLSGVTFGGGAFAAVGVNRVLLISTNGTGWSVSPNSNQDPTGLGNFYAVTYGSDRFVTVGEGSGINGTIATSFDGIKWSQLFGILGGVAYGNHGFVAPGESGSVRVSTDGSRWTNGTVGVGNQLWGATFGGGKYVVVGDKGAICSSTNALNWDARTVGTNTLYAAAFGSNIFVAVGQRRTVVVSTNGDDWHSAAQSPFVGSTLRAVRYGNGRFVAAGAFGEIGVSTDGEHWTLANSPGLPANFITYNSAAYGKGLFVLVGERATIVRSSDGTNWTSCIPQGDSGSDSFSGVAYGSGVFAAVAYNGAVYVSPDGQHWTKGSMVTSPLSVDDSMLGVGYGNGSFVAVANSGRIMQSGDIFSLGIGSWSPNAGLELSLTGWSNKVYRIQSSTDLVNWTNLFAVTNDADVTSFIDTGATNFPSRFYRAVLP